MTTSRIRLLLIVTLTLGALASQAQMPDPLRPAARIVILDVNVVDPQSQTILTNRNVVIEDGMIASVTREAAASTTSDRVISARGRYLMPGMINMHVHVRDATTLQRLLVHGVTTVRSMNGHPGTVRLRQALADGLIAGPHLVTAGPFVSEHEANDWAQHLPSAEQAGEVVRAQAAAGYDFIKIINLGDDPIRGALFRAAQNQGLPVAGHNPDWAAGLEELARYPMASMDHIDEFLSEYLGGEADRDQIEAIVAAVRESGLALTPMLLPAFETARIRVEGTAYLTEEKQAILLDEAGFGALNRTLGWAREIDATPAAERQGTNEAFLLDLLKALADAGVPLLVGTEANPRNAPVGEGFHRELALFERAGLSRWEILAAATATPAPVLGRERSGQIGAGSIADLVLLDANPVADLANLRQIRGVMVGGIWYGPEDLQRLRRMY